MEVLQELLEHLWPDTDAGETALTSAIRDLRRALRHGASARALIASRRGHGYRFTAGVDRVERAPTAPRRAHASATIDTAETQLVGRAAEQERVSTALERAIAGRGSIAVLLGPLGVGKTAIAEALACRARARECDVHVGRCIEGRSYATLWPCLQILRSVSRVDRTAVPTTCTDVSSSTRLRIATQLLDRLAVAAALRPQVLIIENFQWADVDSLSALEFLGQSLEGRRVLLLLTSRETLSGAHQRTLRVFTRVGADSVRCFPLNATDSLQLLAAAAPEPLPESVAEDVRSRAGGIPLFLLELARPSAQPAETLSASREERHIPGRIRDAIELLASSLSPECRRILLHASIARLPFGLKELAQLASRTAPSVALAVAEAEAALLLSEIPGKPGRYAFVHPMYRDVFRSLSATASPA
jgi:predicted ATPase